MTGPRTADDRDAEQVREWNRYVAKVPIDYYGTRAYNPGDKVPVSAVEGDAAWINAAWCDEVTDTSTPNAGSQTMPPPGPPTIDTTVLAAPAGSTPAPIPAPEPAPDTATES